MFFILLKFIILLLVKALYNMQPLALPWDYISSFVTSYKFSNLNYSFLTNQNCIKFHFKNGLLL